MKRAYAVYAKKSFALALREECAKRWPEREFWVIPAPCDPFYLFAVASCTKLDADRSRVAMVGRLHGWRYRKA